MRRTFVGFGFGPIQSGLFLLEAAQSKNFARLVVAEIDAALVQAVREGGGRCTVNVAYPDAIRQVTIENIELYNPRVPADRERLVEAIAGADEIATALPSVSFFDQGNSADAAAVIADGLQARPGNKPAVIYAAENHNHAAEILEQAVRQRAPALPGGVQFLNTVIGKMSGVITGDREMRGLRLAPLVPGGSRAVLVEAFNRILISRITLPGFHRGIEVFIEKDDLLPFEEAKLYGHNAIHAMIGYLASLRGLTTMAQAKDHPDLLRAARKAFIDESGAAMIHRWKHLGDPLFTPQGYRAYAEDLLERMVCPNLNDLVARVVRDPVRKLGYDDRLFGTMRRALEAGVSPRHLALGAGAAVIHLLRERGDSKQMLDAFAAAPPDAPPSTPMPETFSRMLRIIWSTSEDPQMDAVAQLTWEACCALMARGVGNLN